MVSMEAEATVSVSPSRSMSLVMTLPVAMVSSSLFSESGLATGGLWMTVVALAAAWSMETVTPLVLLGLPSWKTNVSSASAVVSAVIGRSMVIGGSEAPSAGAV